MFHLVIAPGSGQPGRATPQRAVEVEPRALARRRLPAAAGGPGPRRRREPSAAASSESAYRA